MRWSTEKRRNFVVIFLLAMTFCNFALAYTVIPSLRRGYQDFTIFYGAARMVRDGQSARLYDLQAQYRLQHEFAPNVLIRQGALPFNHPPFEALLFLPFAYLNYLPAYLLWTVFNVAMLAWSLWVLEKTFAQVRQLGPMFIALAASAFVPVVTGLIQGQDSILLLLLLVVSLAALEKNRDVAAGAALAAGLFKFHLVLPLVLIVAVRRPRVLAGFLPVAALLSFVGAAMVGWNGMGNYLRFLFHLEKTGAGGAIVATSMPNLRGLVADILGTNGGGVLALSLTIVCSIAAMGVALWQVRRRDTPVSFVVAVATVTAILVSYHTLPYDVSWLLPVVLLLFSAPSASGREMQMDVVLLIVVYTVFLAASLWAWLNPLWCVPMVWWMVRKHPGDQAAGAPA